MHETNELWAAAIGRICEDPQSRRELLWLRAREKDDGVEAARLLEVDPSIPTRLRYFHDVGFEVLDLLGERGRRDAYAALYDWHLDWLLGRPSSEEEALERRRLTRAQIGRRAPDALR